MNKISMDALNRGWDIGFGTRIQSQNPDFDGALSRGDVELAPRATPLVKRVAVGVARAESVIAMLVRRLAY